MNSIDITTQPKPEYSFANQDTLAEDVSSAEKLLKKVYEYLADFLAVNTFPSSVSFISNDNRRCRVIIYNFEKLIKKKNLFAVVFYGYKRENTTDKENSEFFNTDWEIAMSMTGNNNILCYASQELADGNWFNIVLFTKPEGKQDVKIKEKHNYAAYTLAPKRFSWVRLHNAIMPNGISGNLKVEYKSTKYYNFDKMWFAKREYQ